MKYDAIRLNHVGVISTMRCTLRCKLCCAGTPYMKYDKERDSLERMTKSFEMLFRMVEYVDKFSIGGGEPLTRADLPELIEFVIGYRDQIGAVEIVTNGTLMPQESLLGVLRKYKEKVEVQVDHYGIHSPCADQIGALLTENGIKSRVRMYYGEECHCGGWVDFGDFSLKHPTKEEQIALYNKCAYHLHIYESGVAYADGLLFTCGKQFIALEKGVADVDDGSYVNLLDSSASVEEKQKELIRLLEIDSPSACAYCNGMCEDSPRFMPAEQLETKKECL